MFVRVFGRVQKSVEQQEKRNKKRKKINIKNMSKEINIIKS